MILTVLLISTAVIFTEASLEALVPQVKTLAESKIEVALGNRFAISIGYLEGGLVRPLVLNDCTIRDRQGKSLFGSLNIVTIRSGFSAWDVLINEETRRRLFGFFSQDSYVDINFSTRNKEVAGFCRIKGDLDNSVLTGRIFLFQKERIDFSGAVSHDSFKLSLNTDQGILNAEGTLSEDGIFRVNIKGDHFRILGFDIVSEAALTAAKDSGTFQTQRLVLNYKTLPNLKADYKISDGVLRLVNLKMGGDINIHGTVSLKRPHILDIVATADNVELGRFLNDFGVKGASSTLSGLLNGKFEFKGPPDKVRSNIHIDMKKGIISSIDFDTLSATFKGDGLILHIEESRITRESGYFALAGDIDLTKKSVSGIFEGIRLVTDDTAINWDGLNTTKLRNVQEVLLEKRMTDRVNINFKKFVADNSIDEALKDRDEVEVEYKLHPNDSLKMMIGRDKDFFGLEHKDKF